MFLMLPNEMCCTSLQKRTTRVRHEDRGTQINKRADNRIRRKRIESENKKQYLSPIMKEKYESEHTKIEMLLKLRNTQTRHR